MVADTMPEDQPFEVEAVSAFQRDGYFRLHRAVKRDCGMGAAIVYGVLEQFSQIGAMTGKGCFPSRKAIGDETGMSVRSVATYLDKLEAAKWIKRRANAGYTSRYFLTDKVGKNFLPPVQNLHTPQENFAHDKETESKNEGVSKSSSGASHPEKPKTAYPEEFEEWWALYPKKKDKAKTFLVWKTLSKADRIAALLGLQKWIESEMWQDDHLIVWPERFLKWRRWEEQPFDPPPMNGKVDPAMAAWMALVEDVAHFDTHGTYIPDRVYDQPTIKAGTAIGGRSNLDPKNNFQRRDFIVAYRAAVEEPK
jgi:hypothetical protein